MSFYKASKEKSVLKQGGDSNYINKSGFYPVNIIAPFVSQGNEKASTIDFFVEYEGQKQVLYGNLSFTNKDGNANEIGQKIFNQLVVISEAEDIDDPIDGELPIGKDGKDKDVAILEDLADINVVIQVQMEYSKYNGDIKEKKVIKGFYRADDFATAEEIVNGTEAGVTYEKSQKYANNITYKDGVTAEQIDTWISASRPKGTAGKASTSTTAKPSFTKKKSKFGKN